jgi:hypothetical protein
VTYLKWQDYDAWHACAGRPALEESEGELPEAVPTLTAVERKELESRRTAYEGAHAVEILPLSSLPVGSVTGERAAVGWASLILAHYEDHTALEVHPPDKILGLAALVKSSIVSPITQTNVGTPEELYLFGSEVTEAAQLSMNLRASITALEHLVPGEYCRTCRAAYRCPALTTEVHETVFGPLQAPDDPDAVPVALGTSREALAPMIAKLPLIEAWVAALKVAAGLRTVSPAPAKRRHRKKSRRQVRPSHPYDHA